MPDERELFAQYNLGLMGNFDDAIARLKYLHDWDQKRIINLENKIKEITENTYKDNKVAEMANKLSILEHNYTQGFPIIDKEQESIIKWKNQHISSMHQKDLEEPVFCYEFISTPLKSIGNCICKECRKKAQSLAFNSGENWSNPDIEKKYLDLFDAKFNFRDKEKE